MATTSSPVSRWTRLRGSLTPAEWRRAGALAFVILALHVIGFGLLLGFVAPQHLKLGTGIFGIGVGITAYTLGMRHAFDADHIGAIDNTTRKLMSDGQRPLSVGFFFSLGHSTVVFLLAVGLAVGIKGLSGDVADDGSALHQATGLIGPTVSGSFLLLIGILNLFLLIGIVRVFMRMRHGRVRRAATRGPAQRARVHEPVLRPRDPGRQEALADVPARAAVRARFRHRHRDRPARHRRYGICTSASTRAA